MKKPQPKTVELVKSDYQPAKAEVEEEFRLDATMDQLAEAILQPVNPRWINEPRTRRK